MVPLVLLLFGPQVGRVKFSAQNSEKKKLRIADFGDLIVIFKFCVWDHVHSTFLNGGRIRRW